MAVYRVLTADKKRKHFSSSQIIILGFLGAIIIGSLLLLLPIAKEGPGGTSFLEAVFTSTASTCVTGLLLHDPGSYWSIFGQVVILLLIQIGGLGVVFTGVLLTKISGRKIGVMQRATLQEAISAQQVGGIVRLTGMIAKVVAVLELGGAVLLAPVMIKEFGMGLGLWYSLFHAVSAFCNAGIDLLGIRGAGSSMALFYGNNFFYVVISILVIMGGIGFLTWDDIRENKWHVKNYRMQTKVVLVTSLILWVGPALYFYFAQFNKDIWQHMSGAEKVRESLFLSVNLRTSGFSTIDYTLFNEPGKIVMVLLMLVGAAPGSTAGGMKVTTLAVLVATAFSVFTRKQHAQLFGRRIPSDTIHYAATLLFLYLVLFLSGAFLISSFEGVPMMTAMFESGAAVGTTGMSLGITATLSVPSKILMIFLMYAGRVGTMTIVYAAITRKKSYISMPPKEKIMVG